MKAEGSSVIWVGPAHSEAYKALQSAIRKRGLRISMVPAANRLVDLLKDHVHPLLVVCDQQTDQQSRSVVDAVDHLARRVPIFVIVEQSNFSDYYYLMHHGVKCYYQLSEGPDRISSAVSWAANSSAA